MNDHESGVLAHLLEGAGYREVPDPAEADVILVNTCAIREKAEQKVYSQLGRYRSLKESRPGLVLAVGGCMAQSEGRRVLSRAPFVDLVFGTHALMDVPSLLGRVREQRRRIVATEVSSDPSRVEALYAHSRGLGLKAFVTVMHGCDNFCAYCVVPHVRGREMSRPASEIVAEVERLSAEGVVEVTLLGQNVNSYGQKPQGDTSFAELVRRVAAVEGVRRIRFTTSHPKDLSEDLITLFAEETKLMPHIHLPLQSGSDRILRAMNRGYTSAHYRALVEKLRRIVPGIAVTSDLIVGFPGETEGDFEATLRVMAEIVFDNLFSFKFSPRPRTAAAAMIDALPAGVKEERLQRLQALQREHTLQRNQELVGRICTVLVEGASRVGGAQWTGRTPENKIVNFPGPGVGVGEELAVRIAGARINSLVGELAGAEAPCTCK
ncbi:MAG: tRNA (N6-isopentenyl adenosine(37)-C2)-methylthiotransferase MiaB [Deltaproteobacteria bacterium]|nr:tRNA (N6-isopentenyl adenosine(37)-C2)-methylthiotransferase MiaB [Deltaproteobacteria bacterium]